MTRRTVFPAAGAFSASTCEIIHAKRASCHLDDGGDLAYFNYTNKSIIARSVFHGLSDTQGKQIASYIRSLDLGLPVGYSRKDAGRPWNPHYQPGPGLDARSLELWAAGAGLDAVLERDSQMKDYLFPNGRYGAARLGADGDLNPHETPQALQFPDWNAWLPTSGIEDLVADPSQQAGSVPITRFKRAIQALDGYDASGTDQALRESQWYFRQFIESASAGFPTEHYFTDCDDPATLPANHATKMKQTRHTLAERAQLQEALALAFLGMAERYRSDQWVRRTADDDAHRTASNFETMNYVAHCVPPNQHVEAWCEWGYRRTAITSGSRT